VAGQTVYVGGYDGNFYALDIKTGHPKWQFAAGDRINSSALVNEGRLFFGSDDGCLYALNLEAGG